MRHLSLPLLLGAAMALAACAGEQGGYELADGGRYQGELRGGRAHGRGVLRWPNGDRYEGEFRNGRMHGRGVLASANGDRYEGELRAGLFHGKGRLERASGETYEGDFAEGYEHGEGVLVEAAGDRYEGEFERGYMHGRGTYAHHDGDVYEGRIDRGRMHGEGVYRTPEGDRYEGRFAGGAFTGQGRLYEEGELRYEGEFVDWRYHGRGTFYWPDGDRYEGEFEDGMFDGEGRIVFAEPAGGLRERRGTWEDGVLQREAAAPAPVAAPEPLDFERVFYRQPALMAAALAEVPASAPGAEVYFLGFAGDGTQAVFLREMRRAEQRVRAHFDRPVHSLLLANHRSTLEALPLANRHNLGRALEVLGERMDRDEDVLFLLMTSHGEASHRLSVELGTLALEGVGKEALRAMLDQSGIRWRVVVLSACYSGGFVPVLAGAHSIVLTAASADKVSFGCSDDNELTYFGEALFEHGLPGAASLRMAAERAARYVREKETAEGYAHSEPQRHFGAAIEAHLRGIRRAGAGGPAGQAARPAGR